MRQFVLLIGCVWIAACDSTLTVAPVTSERELPPPDTKTILIDGSHDGGVWWFPQAGPFDQDAPHQGKALADALRGLGYRVDEVGRASFITADRLRPYPVVIRAGAYGSYTASELAAYSSYASTGHPLVLLSEFLRPNQHDQLAESFGILLTDIFTDSVKTFAAHPLTRDMKTIPYIAGSVLGPGSSPSIRPLAWLSGGQVVMGLVERDTLRVFFAGDTNGFEVFPQPFVKNLIAWAFP